MERTRRLVLGFGVAAAVFMWMYAATPPLLQVRVARPKDKEPAARIRVSGELTQALRAGTEGEGEMAWRASPEHGWSSTGRWLFFREDEPPLDAIALLVPVSPEPAMLWSVDTTTVAVSSAGPREGDPPRPLLVSRWRYGADDFQLGTGLAALRPPDAFFRPLRRYAPWVLLAAVLFYVLLPWPKRKEGVLGFHRAQVVLTDALGAMLLGVFLFLPLAIAGGSTQAFVMAWPLLVILWGMALFGVWILAYGAWGAGYAVRIGADAISVRTDREWETFPFAEMERFGPGIRRLPGWVRGLLLIGALTGRGGAAGAAAMGSVSESPAVAVRLTGGRTLFVWLGEREVHDALTKAKVPMTEEPVVSTGFGRVHVVRG